MPRKSEAELAALTEKGFEFNDYILDYKKALMLDYIPKSMAILGAGYVAV